MAMNEQYNEEMAWRRMLDLQREMENRRLVGDDNLPDTIYLAQLLVERARSFVRAVRARRRPAQA
jgi:hypothetical protein